MQFEKDEFHTPDKFEHLMLHLGLTAFIILFGVNFGAPIFPMAVIAFVISLAGGIIIEGMQATGLFRDIKLIGEAPFSWKDLIANEVGWLLGVIFCVLLL